MLLQSLWKMQMDFITNAMSAESEETVCTSHHESTTETISGK